MSVGRKARGGVSFVVAPPARVSDRAPMRAALLAIAVSSLALWAVILGGIGHLVGWW